MAFLLRSQGAHSTQFEIAIMPTNS